MPECKKCGAEFETGPKVGEHAREAHSKAAKAESTWVPYRCYACPALFYDAQEYSTHRGLHNRPDEPFWEWFWATWS